MTLTISIAALILSIFALLQQSSQTKNCDRLEEIMFDNSNDIHKLKTTKQDKSKRGRPRKMNTPKQEQLNGIQ